MEVGPLTFYCRKRNCGWMIHLNSVEELERKLKKGLRCELCGGKMLQSMHVFVHICGQIEEIDPPRHCNENMQLKKGSLEDVSTWYFRCSKCGERRNLEKYCPQCNERMTLKPCTASGVIVPIATTFTNYEESYENQMLALIDYFKLSETDFQRDLEQLKNSGYTDDEAETMVQALVKTKQNMAVSKLKPIFGDEDKFKDGAEKISDYKTIEKSSSKEEIVAVEKYGISHAYLVGDLKLIDCVYGYMVGTYDIDKVKEKDGFQLFQKGVNYEVFVRPVGTEGILFELDRSKVIKWLYQNNYIDDDLLKNMQHQEPEIKKWLAQQIWGINENTTVSMKLNELVHSMSHALIKTATLFCGVASENISEILFPEIPAFLVYNTSKSNLGSMYTLFEVSLEDWFNAAHDTIKKCVYDPVCINDETAACHVCMFLNEMSCRAWNKNLNRRCLIGGKNEIGYWSDELV